jgi:hypothetical protein
MPASDTRQGQKGGRLLTVLFWVGVGLAPLAALLLLVVQGEGTLRIAAVLAILAVVLIGLSIALRKDTETVRLELEETLLDEVDLLREDVRQDIATAARAQHRQFSEKLQTLYESVESLRAHLDTARYGRAAEAHVAAQAPPVQAGHGHPGPAQQAGGHAGAARMGHPGPAPQVGHAHAGSAGVPGPGPGPGHMGGGVVGGGVVRHTETVQVTTRQTIVDPHADGQAGRGTVYGGGSNYGGTYDGGGGGYGRGEARGEAGGFGRGEAGGYGRGEAGGFARGDGAPAPRAGRSGSRGDSGWGGSGSRGDSGWGGSADEVPRSEYALRAEPESEPSWTEQLLRERLGQRVSEPRTGGESRGSGGEGRGSGGEGRGSGGEGRGSGGEGRGSGSEGRRSRAYEADEDDPAEERWSSGRAGDGAWSSRRSGPGSVEDRWATVRSDERGRELRIGERRTAMHADESGTELRIEDRWASVRREEGWGRRGSSGDRWGGGDDRWSDDRWGAGTEDTGRWGEEQPQAALPSAGGEPSWGESRGEGRRRRYRDDDEPYSWETTEVGDPPHRARDRWQ